MGPKGSPLYAEANGDHKGGIKSKHVGQFIDKLMRKNPGKEVWVILDNYRPHRSIAPETARIQLTKNYPRVYASFSFAPTTYRARQGGA